MIDKGFFAGIIIGVFIGGIIVVLNEWDMWRKRKKGAHPEK